MVDLPREPDLRAIARRIVCARPGEEPFDDEFWSSMTGEQRVEVTWLMTLETLALEGVDEEPRLDKSIGVIHRP